MRPAPTDAIVRLCYASLPAPLTALAIHHWFVVFDPGTVVWHRWEVWQEADAGCGASWGHVHQNLMAMDGSVGGGPGVIEREWRGEAADRLARVLSNSRHYPERGRYAAWPGPNSNTYAAWVLRQAEIAHDLDPRAIGKDFLGPYGMGISATRDLLQVECPLIGAKVGRRHGAEIHLLGLTFGVTTRPFAVKTPFGRFDGRLRRSVSGP